MSGSDHEVERIFRGLLELGDEVECDSYLGRECGGDGSLRRRVEALVRAHQSCGDFLEFDVGGERLDGGDGGGEGLAGGRVAGYRVLRLVSGGASCVVYLAEQLEPVRRPVALKLSRPGEDLGAACIRFAAERQAMAVLDHPNVVQLYDAGEWGGLPYIVTEWVAGEGILEYAQQGDLSTVVRVELFLQACLGVAHGHERGVVHRDIKPGNILVTERDGEALVKVIDFGVAGASGHEASGGEGTPGYMSPEQLAGGVGAVDVRSDIYGLGVLLHELLAGYGPRVVRGVGWAGYESGHHSGLSMELVGWMSGGLEGVLKRALAWERDGRYGSVMEMVEDVRECLGTIAEGGQRGRFVGGLRRHRVLMGVTGVLAGLGLAWLAQVIWESGMWNGGGVVGAGLYRQREVEAMGRSDVSEAMYWASRGLDGVEGGEGWAVGFMGERVAWPVRFLQVEGLVEFLGFSPSGRYVVVMSEGGGCWVWDWEVDEVLLRGGELGLAVSVDWAGAEDLLAVGRSDGVVEVLRFPGGQRIAELEYGERVGVVGFGGEDRYLAVAGRGLRIWDMEHLCWLGEVWEHPDEIYGLGFSVEGGRLVTACEDGRARVFRLGEAGGELGLVGEYPHARRVAVESAELCCDNALIETDAVVPLLVGEGGVLSWSGLGRVSYWDGGRELAVVGETCHATRMVRSVDGEWVAVALRKGGLEYRRVAEFEMGVGKRVEHGERVFDVDFDMGRGRLLTASADRTVGVWDLGNGGLVYPLMKHAREVVHGDISDDGRLTVTAQLDGQVRLWVLPGAGLQPGSLWDGEAMEVEAVVSGGILARVGEGLGDLGWLRLESGELGWEVWGVEGGCVAAAASGVSDLAAAVWRDGEGGRLGVSLGGEMVEVSLPFIPDGVAWLPGADGLVLSDTKGSLWRVMVGDGGLVAGELERLVKLAFQGNGGRFEISGGGGYVVCWRGRELVGVFDLETGKSLGMWGEGGRLQMSLSPVEDVCLTVEAGDVLRVRGLGDRRALGVELRHAGGILSHAFSPDGKWVATAGHDGRMLIWDWLSGVLVCPPLDHGEEVVDLVFGKAGVWVATLSRAGTVRVWDTGLGFLLYPPWAGEQVESVGLFDWDGDLLVAGGARGWIWELGGWRRGCEGGVAAGLVGEVISGLGGDRGELLGSESWGEKVGRLRALRSEWF